MIALRQDKCLFICKRGQSMVEFALILPLVVLVIAGIFDLGRAFFSSITITNAAREGARYGSLNPDYSQGICKAALDEARSSGINLSSSNVTISCNTTVQCLDASTPMAGCADGQPISVTVNYTYNEMLLKFFFPTGIDMHRKVEMFVP